MPSVRDIIGRATGRKGLGVSVRDALVKGDRDVTQLSLPHALAGAASMMDFVQRVRDQQWFGRCMGSALAGAIEDREAYLGHTGAHISDDFIYACTRGYMGTLGTDSGSDPVFAVRALSKLGAATVLTHPIAETTKQLTTPPTSRAYEDAHDRQGGTYYAVKDDSPSGRIEAIRVLLGSGFPPVVVGPVFESWMTREWVNNPERVIDVPAKGDAEVGWHAYRIVAIGDDDTCLMINSWGRDWRDGGFAQLSRDFVTKRIATVRVVDGWRKLMRPAGVVHA